MKNKIILWVILFVPTFLFAQYWQERTTEHNFEKSNLFFKSHFLNPFGMKNIKQQSLSLIDNPFLNSQINPAIMPNFKNGSTYIYLDFRGDRTEAPIVSGYVMPMYYNASSSYRYIPDYRLISTSREEPEPIVSLGLITYPISSLKDKFYVGASFQYINSKDKFYSTPFHIHNTSYDSRLANEKNSSVPIIDRYAGKDEMHLKGKLLTAFTGYRINNNLSLGLSLNTISYNRDGSYLNENNDQYGQQDNEHRNINYREREQTYNHLDFAIGLMYNAKEDFSFGVKGGILNGDVNQNHLSERSYYYRNNQPEVSENWWLYSSKNNNNQKWDHDGNTKYIGLNFIKPLKNSTLKGYYKYSSTKINSLTHSSIFDTSFSSSRWVSSYDTTIYIHNGHSLTKDNRSGIGTRKSSVHEAMINIDWKLNEKTKLLVGLYVNNTSSSVRNTEKALSKREDYYKHEGRHNSLSDRSTIEDKELTWYYDNEYFTFQIPIIVNFQLNETFGFMLGVSRIFQEWNIKNRTDVYFNKREKKNNDVENTETDFIERYTLPNDSYTDDYTNIFARFNVAVTKSLDINLLIDPEFEDTFRIAQWWLSFKAEL